MKSEKDLKAVLEAVRNKWGDKALQTGISRETPHSVATGFPELDAVVGGLPRGRLTQLIGRPTSGMTTLALKTAGTAQQEQDLVVYLDLPRTFDPDYAAYCGVKITELLLIRPPSLTDADSILFDVVTSGIPGVVIFNAMDGLPTHLETILGRLYPALTRSRCMLLLLTSTLPLSYVSAATVRLLTELEEWVYAGRDVIGYQARVTVLKHPTVPEGRKVDIQVRFNGESL